MQGHSLQCEAVICAKSAGDDVVWWPGEATCSFSTKVTKNQRRINKLVSLGSFKHMDTYFTGKTLGKIGRVTSSTKGIKDRAGMPLKREKCLNSPIEVSIARSERGSLRLAF